MAYFPTTFPTPLNSVVDLLQGNAQGYAVLASGTGAAPTTADVFEHGCLYYRTDSGTGVAAVYQNTGSRAVPAWTLLDTALPGDTASSLVDANSVTTLAINTTASAVNGLMITNSATGAVGANAVTFLPGAPSGSDAAISLTITPKGATGIMTLGLASGTGSITLGSSSAAQTTNVGTGAGVSTVNVATGAAANVVTIGAAASAVTIKGTVTQSLETNRVTAGGSNNAVTGALLDSAGVAIATATGLKVTLIMGAITLQAGANTFNLNSTSAIAIKKASAPTVDIAVARAANSIVELVFNGTSWLALSE